MEDREHKKEAESGAQQKKKPLFSQEPRSKRMRVTRQAIH